MTTTEWRGLFGTVHRGRCTRYCGDIGPVEISLDCPNIILTIEGSVKTSVVLESVILKSVFDALVLAFLSDMTCMVDKVLKTSCLL